MTAVIYTRNIKLITVWVELSQLDLTFSTAENKMREIKKRKSQVNKSQKKLQQFEREN